MKLYHWWMDYAMVYPAKLTRRGHTLRNGCLRVVFPFWFVALLLIAWPLMLVGSMADIFDISRGRR